MTRRIRRFSLVLVLTGLWMSTILSVGACGHKLIQTTAVANQQLAHVIESLQSGELVGFQAGRITTTDHQRWQRTFDQIAQIGLAVNVALRAGDGKTALAQITAMLDLLTTLERQDAPKLQPQDAAVILASLGAARSLLATLATQTGGR